MSFLPPAIPPRGRGLPMPALTGPRNTVTYSETKSLPMPVLVPTEMPKTPAARATVIEHIKESIEKPKRGRATKAELKKLEKAAMSERVRGLLDTKPDKKDIVEYIKARITELAD